MHGIKRKMMVGAALAAAAALGQPVWAQAPTGKPFSLRGVELGVTIDQFRQMPVPNDGGRYAELRASCSDAVTPRASVASISAEDRADGIVDCRWYSRDTLLPYVNHDEHWFDIGTGKAQAVFRFIPVQGEPRLFRISVYANGQYYPGVHDALTRGYGPAREIATPFKTQAGGDFTSLTSVWSNGLSTITLIQRCGHLERYCLTYDHAQFSRLYTAIEERRAAAAAGRI